MNYCTIKQFLFLRKDLPNYNTGALLAQACHASVAAIHTFRSHPDTVKYLENISDLTTVIYEICEKDIEKIKELLTDLSIDFYIWVENYEIVTCIGTRPIETKSFTEFERFRKQFRLFK